MYLIFVSLGAITHSIHVLFSALHWLCCIFVYYKHHNHYENSNQVDLAVFSCLFSPDVYIISVAFETVDRVPKFSLSGSKYLGQNLNVCVWLHCLMHIHHSIPIFSVYRLHCDHSICTVYSCWSQPRTFFYKTHFSYFALFFIYWISLCFGDSPNNPRPMYASIYLAL